MENTAVGAVQPPTGEDAGPELLDEATLEKHPQFASTLANGLAVLGCYDSGAPALGNKEIAERLGLTRPTVSRLTFTLMGLGYLRRDRKTRKYSLGAAVLSLGYPLLSQLTIRQVAGPEMLDLACYAHGPVSVGTRDRLQVVYVETAQGAETNSTKPGIGSTRPFLALPSDARCCMRTVQTIVHSSCVDCEADNRRIGRLTGMR